MIQTAEQPISLPVIQEWHSSELTANCLRAVFHRHLGEIHPEYTTALFRGALAGEVLRLMHEKGFESIPVVKAIENVLATAQQENRPLSESVEVNKTEIAAEVEKVCKFYAGRLKDPFSKCKLIGCELPIRCTIEVDDRPVEFASHLDLLFRHPDRSLHFWDWKWRDEAPTTEYLSRNLQFGMYAYAIRHGEVMLSDGAWVNFEQWPTGSWIHLPNFKPYSRNGADYRAGEHRDLDKIIRQIPYDDRSEKAIKHEFAQRVRMANAGFWPTNADPVACHICESNSWCNQFTPRGSQ